VEFVGNHTSLSLISSLAGLALRPRPYGQKRNYSGVRLLHPPAGWLTAPRYPGHPSPSAADYLHDVLETRVCRVEIVAVVGEEVTGWFRIDNVSRDPRNRAARRQMDIDQSIRCATAKIVKMIDRIDNLRDSWCAGGFMRPMPWNGSWPGWSASPMPDFTRNANNPSMRLEQSLC